MVFPAGGVPPDVSVECSLFGSVPVFVVAASWKYHNWVMGYTTVQVATLPSGPLVALPVLLHVPVPPDRPDADEA